MKKFFCVHKSEIIQSDECGYKNELQAYLNLNREIAIKMFYKDMIGEEKFKDLIEKQMKIINIIKDKYKENIDENF